MRIAGYRYLQWSFGKDSPALDDVVIHGLYTGAR